MAAPSQSNPDHEDVDREDDIDEEDFFIEEDEVLEIVEDDGDHPMDEDDDNEEAPGTENGDDATYEDTSIQNFSSHKSSVFTVAAHPSQPLAASGGEDDLGYIWNVLTGEEVVKLMGHTDSVSTVAWSFDGEMVSTGGMDGKVRIWRRVGKDDWTRWEFLTELQGPDEVMWLRWHPKGTVLLAGSNDSTVWLWQLPSGNTMQVFAGHEAPVQAGIFTADGKRVVTGDGSGTLILWDPRSPTPVWKMTPLSARFGMEGGITAITSNPSSTVVVVGGAEGEVRVVNLAKGEVVGVLEGHQQGESVEAAEFVDWGTGTAGTAGFAVTGATDGKIHVWDMSTYKLRATLSHDDSITSINPHPLSTGKGNLVTSASSDKTLKTWDTRTGDLLKEHKGHRGPVLGASIGSFEDNVYALSAGDDGACLVFDAKL
ncbi:hypothetical protein FRC02_005427 [Tulasnella sp. 418]|nr:hypothetical protein FRC02_005427 [Tulasnella sp. 418]